MDGFSEWARHHCTVFGLFTPQQVEMVSSWQPLFDSCGWTAADLKAATNWLAANCPPEFPSRHLGAIQQCVRSRRAIDLDAMRERPDRPACIKCGGSGMLIVPHLIGVRNREWVGIKVAWSGRVQFYTCSIRCQCERGHFLQCTDRKGNRLMDQDEYEGTNPGWRQQMARRDKELTEEAAASGSPELRKAVDSVVRSVRRNGDV